MTKEAIDIKGTKKGLIILLSPDREFEDIKLGLKNKMETSAGFFRGARFSLSGEKQLVPEQKNELEAICREYGLIPSKEIKWPPDPHIQHRTEQIRKKTFSIPGEPALLIKGNLRSGQKITHNGHVTILGNIHPGAEVISNGNVIIMGSCAGFVHAGANHKPNSYIITLSFQRAHIRIADIDLFETPGQSFNGPILALIKNNSIDLSVIFI